MFLVRQLSSAALLKALTQGHRNLPSCGPASLKSLGQKSIIGADGERGRLLVGGFYGPELEMAHYAHPHSYGQNVVTRLCPHGWEV